MIPYDSAFARGVRAPGPVPTRDAWRDTRTLRKAAFELEQTINSVLPDTVERAAVVANFDMVMSYAESILARYSRSGPPADQSEIADMEATLRLAAKNKEQFKSFDVEGLRKAALALRKKGVV